jgi:uncharacterized protein (DUF305 family)
MKNFQWILALPLMYLTLFSCNKDNDEDVQPPAREDNEFLKNMNKMNNDIISLQLSGHTDEDFALAMVIHHQTALDMANRELQEGNDEVVKSIAQQIVTTKTVEKDSLTNWLIGRNPTRNATGEKFDADMLTVLENSKNLDAVNITGDADNDFAQLMIIHNKTLADIAQLELQLGHHDDMKAWARQMILDQNKTTADLNAWLTSNQN